jgi:hypothetical protein
LHESPKKLELDEATKEKFQTTFGVKWDDVIASNNVLNLSEAIALFPDKSIIDIAQTWRSGGSVKLLPGTYVGKVEDVFVINGFYADMVSSWKDKDAKVLFYLVTWKEEDLSWADFRGKIIGSTDPEKADPKSIRGVLLKEFESTFHLTVKPTTTLNGVHASAGPIEGARECGIWGKMDGKHVFSLEKAARSTGVSSAVWKNAMDNCKIELKDGKKGLIFDVTEGFSAKQAVEVLKELSSL